ncbi:Serine/threonine protein kinase ppk15 [Entamoeba marina]
MNFFNIPHFPCHFNYPVVSDSITKRLSTRVLITFSHCNKKSNSHSYQNVLNRNPFPTVLGGLDNQENELIVRKEDIIGSYVSKEGRYFSRNPRHISQYYVLDKLGSGMYGQVYECYDLIKKRYVAIKVLKSMENHLRQGLLEVSALHIINKYFDVRKSHIEEMFDSFLFNQHLCIVTELLNKNLYEYCKERIEVGLRLEHIINFSKQLMEGIKICSSAGIIHGDIKPENILLTNDGRIKIIDFGSASFENYTLYSNLQSRNYRAPEITFGMPYNSSVDLWSVGCVIFELFTGIPLFHSRNDYELVERYTNVLKNPQQHILKRGNRSHKYFNISHTVTLKKENGI